MVTGDLSFRQVCESTLDFMLGELSDLDPNSSSAPLSFYSSLDADFEGVEGKYYVWGYTQVKQALSAFKGGPEDVDLFDLFQAAFTSPSRAISRASMCCSAGKKTRSWQVNLGWM